MFYLIFHWKKATLRAQRLAYGFVVFSQSKRLNALLRAACNRWKDISLALRHELLVYFIHSWAPDDDYFYVTVSSWGAS